MRILLCTLILLISSTVQAADYKIDPEHSSVSFKIKHLAIATVTGRFVDFSGIFSFNPADIPAAHTTATIKAASINTENAKRDEHLRGPDFFDTAKFPELNFVSKKTVKLSDRSFSVEGVLSLHGVAKPVLLNVTFEGEANDPWGNTRAAFSAVAKINRKDFGLTWSKTLDNGALLVGNDVTIELSIEGIKQK